MTVGERLDRAEAMLMLARCACGQDGTDVFATSDDMRHALDRVLVEISEDVYRWLRLALSAKTLKRTALDDDEREAKGEQASRRAAAAEQLAAETAGAR